ncbi:permease [Chloroflexia bacterium SDU3-3]|nr:permease [Chloroflexia bacterium SDU3-3]
MADVFWAAGARRLAPSARMRRAGLWGAAALLAAALWLGSGLLVPAALAGLAGRLRGFVTVFLGIFFEALPFLLAGVVVSAAIELYLTPERIQRAAPRGALGAALLGALLGLAFPVCECGAVPAARRLMQKGAHPALGIAFVLAAPVVNPVVIISTAVAFVGTLGWGFVAWRVGLTLVVAMAVAMALGGSATARDALWAHLGALDAHAGHHHHEHGAGWLAHLLGHAREEFFEMSRFLVIGGLLAAALQTFISPAALTALGQGPVLSVLAMMLLAAALSICSTVDAFVALSFVGSFAPSALLAFLVFGPMVDIKSVLMFTSTFPPRAVAGLVLLSAALVAAACVALNLLGAL